MYRITGVEAVASVTDLRTQIDETIKAAEETGEGVLVQKNNEPIAVLVSIERWRELQSENESE
ncbi:type II toxin-antitoxin system Phd/YefM family antitoxin [Salinibacter ruber]|uniref:type II toxin-antitoxin system Phd/YefM family antitoxin n=1 Tax=Salinibacter ruber TaxID=146919 RepID=UPI002167DCE3|nr:type II toxin-antitoxin system Phd/YefM family antitoxin [Salinibacter ruber]